MAVLRLQYRSLSSSMVSRHPAAVIGDQHHGARLEVARFGAEQAAGLMASAISSSGASAKLCRVGNRLNNFSVTILTRASVHCAESRVANSNS